VERSETLGEVPAQSSHSPRPRESGHGEGKHPIGVKSRMWEVRSARRLARVHGVMNRNRQPFDRRPEGRLRHCIFASVPTPQLSPYGSAQESDPFTAPPQGGTHSQLCLKDW